MHRGWLDHPALGQKKEPFCKRAAWAWMIEEASYEPRTISVGGKVIELQRGQFSHSLRFMAQAWGWQHDRCRRFVASLSQCCMIATASATDSATAQLVITICNYERYQVSSTGDATVNATSPASAVRQQRDRLKEGNQGKEKDSKNLRGDGLGRCAPSERDASAGAGPPAATSNGHDPDGRRDAGERARDASDLTPEECAERVAILEGVKATLRSGMPRSNIVRDPAAYERAARDYKRDAWLKELHTWVGSRFDGDQRMRAWEAINAARLAGSRDATPKPIRKLIDDMDKLRQAERESAA
jgi:hypothetical protein